MTRAWSRLLGAVLITASLTAATPGARAATATPDATPSWHERTYPGDPTSESVLVASEDDRLDRVQTVGTLARLSEVPFTTPYRLSAGSADTLVLTPRSEPYTTKDLLRLAPRTFVSRPNGSYLLSEHVVVLTGATLKLARPGGLDLRLASDEDSFVSIVNVGGRLELTGSKGAPARVSSFDRNAAGADTATQDGRAYIRSINGRVVLRDVEISRLGFWSGRTGGLSLTGTEDSIGEVGELGETLDLDKVERLVQTSQPQPQLSQQKLDDVQSLVQAGRASSAVGVSTPPASLTRVRVEGNAFGLFVSSVDGLSIRESAVRRSLVDGIALSRDVNNALVKDTVSLSNGRDGITMDRNVTSAVVRNTVSQANGRDGIAMGRATTDVAMFEISALSNQRNGVTISGLPLATGPGATGISVESYGNNTVSRSEIAGNRRYGVEVIGGVDIGVHSNDLDGHDMGVVVREGAAAVKVVGNQIEDSQRQGIAVRDGVTEATVSQNTVEGGETSVYLRDSDGTISGNTLADASTHAIALLGDIGSTTALGNTISGRGPSAIDTTRAIQIDDTSWNSNLDDGWEDTTPLLVTVTRYLQPLTVLWIALGALLLYSALTGVRRTRTNTHPYADKAPLHGVVQDRRRHEELAP